MPACFLFLLYVLFCNVRASQLVDPLTQEVNTWQFQYRKESIDDVTHAYENGFLWDSKNDVGFVFGGHLGTYWGQTERDFINVKNTNMTYLFSFDDRKFRAVQPALRPPKRCGTKIIFDDSWNHFIAIGGGAEQFDFSYYEPTPNLTVLTREGSESVLVPRTIAPWAFNAETGQWYALRPLHHSAPAAYAPHGGWGGTYCFAREYGLALLAPTNSERVHAYSSYSNQWVLLPRSSSGVVPPPEEHNICSAYDLKNRRMVWLNANTKNGDAAVKTWAYDIGTKEWSIISSDVTPTRSLPSWYYSYGSIVYDRRNAAIVYLHSSGSETWLLYSDSASWIKSNNISVPPSCGSMGEGLAYDGNRNAVILFANKLDEVWTYKTGLGVMGRPEPPVGLVGITTGSGIALSWNAPSDGTVPEKYRIYRAAWEDNKTNGSGIVPHTYELIDSTSQTSFVDNSDTLRTSETFHSYFIESVSIDGQKSDPSTPVYTRLRVPFGLVATAYANNRVVLRWKPKAEDDLVGYNVYRRQRTYPFTRQMLSNRINQTLLAEPFFVDTSVRICGTPLCPDSLVMYCVTAVNRLGKESGLSPFATTAPDWPVNVWADTVNRIIRWTPPRNGNIQSYRIYSGYQYDRGYGSTNITHVGTTTDTFWSYSVHTAPQCYKVRAYSAMGQLGHFSDVLAVQTKDTLGFGNHKLDFQAVRPENDTFFSDVPGIASEKFFQNVPDSRADLVQVFPNPFNPVVSIIVNASGVGVLTRRNVEIFDSSGRLVGIVPLRSVGRRSSAVWDGTGKPSGVYLALIPAHGRISKQRLLLVR